MEETYCAEASEVSVGGDNQFFAFFEPWPERSHILVRYLWYGGSSLSRRGFHRAKGAGVDVWLSFLLLWFKK